MISAKLTDKSITVTVSVPGVDKLPNYDDITFEFEGHPYTNTIPKRSSGPEGEKFPKTDACGGGSGQKTINADICKIENAI